eukprot:gnl/Dysnectes_brevis/1154_a1288_3827.p1 GENE.gnl/Dysnectes_brevis/1154_a1288_3827~~gnl/Dysnectes_brevis/1154_a1288_3827.p1  ORF type:complete len:491 (+),score=204.07 gnl/Dysnectes_brevis/1154_a1288_3827:22-1473(+)
MDGKQYDVIVLGTGLKESVLSGLLSVHGHRVLHIDRNNYYGGDCASLNLDALYEHFGEEAPPPTEFGASRDWNIDLVPKFIMSAGKLVAALRHADVLKYLDFGRVGGSFVIRDEKKGGKKVHRVPSNAKAVLASKLMTLFEKRRMKNLLEYIQHYEQDPEGHEPSRTTMRELYASYKLSENTQDFMGHAMALYTTNEYLDQPALETCRRIKLYVRSMARYGQSPYIYPLYGLGDLPQAFARLSAVWGGTYMLNQPLDELLFDEAGHVRGIRSGESTAYAPIVIGDPSYFQIEGQDLVQMVGRCVRGICLLKRPIPQCEEQSDKDEVKKGSKAKPKRKTSAQVIIPAAQCGRSSDVYVTTQGATHKTTPKHMCIGFVSADCDVAGDINPEAELAPGLELLGTAGVLKQFLQVQPIMAPTSSAAPKGIFISRSYDATSHFETTITEVLDMFEAITGEQIDLSKPIERPAIPGAELAPEGMGPSGQ